MNYRHVAVLVGDDLRAAEEYYAGLFGMEVVLREGAIQGGGPEAGVWAQLPPDKSWEDADAAGAAIGMVALARDGVTLALFAAQPTGDRLYAVGLVMEPDEIEALGDRLTDEAVEDRRRGWLAFIDRHGLRWQLSDTAPFRGAGARGAWLDV